jgi:general secretion pathway protein I
VKRASARGFSLLEVMVALAIFGLMITGILAAQASLAATNKKASNMGLATNLGRCKMTELEEKLILLGYMETDEIEESVACCEGAEGTDFLCDTKVQKVTMPDPPSSTFGDGGTPFGGGGDAATPESAITSAQLDLDAGLAGLGTQLQSQTGSSGSAGLLNMALGIVYPTMKPMFEASIRRLTVVVRWKQGKEEQKLELVQFVTNPQRGGFLGGPMMGGDGGPMPAVPQGAPGGGTTTTTGPAQGSGFPATGGIR